MPEFLTKEKFLESLQLAPRLVVEVICTDGGGRFALLLRTSEPFIGLWHIPGSFLLKDETIEDCYKRILVTEIKTHEQPKYKFIGLRENIAGDPRGHILHYVVLTRLSEPSDEGAVTWFSQIPDDTIPFQKDFIKGALQS